HVGNNFPLKFGLVEDARASLEYMVELIKAEHRGPEREPLDLNPMKREALNSVFNSNIPMPEGVVSPVKLTMALDKLLSDDAIITAEPGISAIFPSALLSLR